MTLNECFCATLPNFKNDVQSIQNGTMESGNNLRDSVIEWLRYWTWGGGGNFDNLQNNTKQN